MKMILQCPTRCPAWPTQYQADARRERYERAECEASDAGMKTG
jgi:hypothetical protein